MRTWSVLILLIMIYQGFCAALASTSLCKFLQYKNWIWHVLEPWHKSNAELAQAIWSKKKILEWIMISNYWVMKCVMWGIRTEYILGYNFFIIYFFDQLRQTPTHCVCVHTVYMRAYTQCVGVLCELVIHTHTTHFI